MKIKGFILLLLLSIAMCKVAVAQEPFLPFYWLEGRVIKPQNAPSDVSIANRLVIFYCSNEVEEDKYIFTWTNNEGRFHLNVFDLYYRYGRKIDFQDFSNYKVEIPRGSDGWGSDPVSVSWEVDKGYTSIEVTLKPGGRLLPGAISVKVRNEAGSSLPGVKILVNIEEKGSTNDNGELLISKVPPGGYDVRAIKDGYRVGYQRVSVYSAQTTNVDFTLSPLPNGYGVLCGYVTDEAGNFLSGVKIVLVSETGQQSYEALSDGGWFQLEVPEGSYTLTASLGGYQDFRADLTISAKEVRRNDILLRFLDGDRGTIEGKVRDINTGGGISGAKVTDGIREVKTSKEGEFQIVVPYGTYIFRVLANGYLPTSEEITVNNPSVSKDFFLRKLDPGKSCICGYVRDTSGKSIVEASVSIGVSSVLTTWEGWYEFDNIDPGHYSITVRKESYKSQTKEIDLLSGEVREVISFLNDCQMG